MHILCVGGFNYPGSFGDSFRIPILSQFLIKKGVKVSFLLITNPRDRFFQSHEILKQIEIFRVFPYIYHKQLNPALIKLTKPIDVLPNTYRQIRKLEEIIKNERVDLVVGFMPCLAGGFSASFCKRFQKSFILDVSDFEYYTPFWKPLRKIERSCIYKADIITVINKYIKNYIQDLGISSRRIKHIPNGVNFELFNRQVDGNTIKKKFQNRPIIMHVGGFYSIDFVMKALPLVVDENPNVLFVFVGPDNFAYYESVTRKLKYSDHLIFIKSVPHEFIPQYIAAADICIHIFKKTPYLEYAQPLKILEYLACGKPIVSTDLIGVRDILKSNVLREFLVKDYESFAGKINELLRENDLRERIGKIGYDVVRRNYDWELISKKFLKICEKII